MNEQRHRRQPVALSGQDGLSRESKAILPPGATKPLSHLHRCTVTCEGVFCDLPDDVPAAVRRLRLAWLAAVREQCMMTWPQCLLWRDADGRAHVLIARNESERTS